MKPDGTVVIDTKIKTDGAQVGIEEIKNTLGKVTDTIDSYNKSVQEYVDNYAANMEAATKSNNEFQREIETLKKNLEDLEGKGLYFGDEEYDDAYLKLKKVEQALKDYKKELVSPTPDANILDGSTLEGQIERLTSKLTKLREQGKGFGDSEFDSTAQALKRAEQALSEYKNELFKTDAQRDKEAESARLAEIGQNAKISNPLVVKLREEIERLTLRQKDLKKAGLGPGYEEYDTVTATIKKLNAELTRYTTGTKKAGKETKKLNTGLKNTEKSSRGAKMGIGRMLATSILFSTVFRAISMVTAGLKEGMDNLAQYSDDTNQALSILMSAMTQLKNAFATAFSPLIEFVAPALAQFINLLSQAVTWTAQLLAALTGKDTFVKAVKVQQDYADSLDKTKDETEEAADATEKSLAPFDQLIQLTQKKKDKDKNELKPEDMFKTEVVSNEIKAQVDAIKDTMDSIKSRLLEMKDIFTSGFWEGLGDYKPILSEISKDFQSIKDHLKSIFTDAEVMESANRMVNAFVDMAGKMAGAMVSVGLTIAANLIGGFESYLSNNTERIKEWLITVFDVTSEIYTLWGDFFVAFADVFSVFASQTAQDITGLIIQIFSDLFMGFTELVAKFTRDVTDLFLSPFIENKDRIKTAIENTLNPIKTIIEGIASVVRNVVDGVIALYDTHIHPLFMTLKDEVSNFLEILLDGYNSYIAPVLDKVAKKFKEVMEGKVGDAINSALRFIGKLVDFIRLCWEQVVFPIINWIAEKMLPFISPALEAIGNVVIDVLGTIADVIGSVFDVLSGLIDFITGVFTGNWEAAWQGVKDIFAGIWDGIVSVIEGAVKIIEGIIDGIKGTIDAVFGTDFSDSDSISGRTRRYESYPASVYAAVPYKMPRLATGTVVPPRAGEFAAILGDNKRETEVVSPLSTMKQAFKEALFESGIGAGERDINIELVLDGQRFARAVYKANNQERQRVGVRMVTNG